MKLPRRRVIEDDRAGKGHLPAHRTLQLISQLDCAKGVDAPFHQRRVHINLPACDHGYAVRNALDGHTLHGIALALSSVGIASCSRLLTTKLEWHDGPVRGGDDYLSDVLPRLEHLERLVDVVDDKLMHGKSVCDLLTQAQ